MTELLPAPTERDLPPAEWRMTDRFVLRITGLPIEAAQSLRFPQAISWADSVLAGQDELRAQGARLSDLLHAHIAGMTDEQARGTLVRLRREIYNNRLPRDPAAALGLLAQAPGGLAELVEGWLVERAQVAELRQAGAAILQAETSQRRTRLRELAGHPRFRNGMVFASATLDTYLDGYLRAGDSMNKRARRVERSVLDYLYRVACKTSPFSTFTGVALGELTDQDGRILVGDVDPDWSSYPRINVVTISRLIESIVDNSAFLFELAAQLTPGWSMDLDRVRFVRRTVTHGDDEATVSFDTVRENLFFLRQNGVLGRLLELLDGGQRLRVGELVSRLRAVTGEDAEQCADYLRVLIKVGLLWLPELQIDVHATDPLATFADSLRGLGHGWTGPLADRLAELAALIASYPDSDLPGKRAIVAGTRQRLTEVFASIGVPDGSLPQTLVFEDARATRAVVTADRQRWSELVTGSLQRVSDVLPAFDLSAPHQLLLKGFFLARYGHGGRCEDVLRFVHEFGEDIYDEYNRVSGRRPTYDDQGRFTGHENWLAVPGIEALNQARSHFGDTMRALWESHDPTADELSLPEDLIERTESILQPLRTSVRPQGFFLQLAGTEQAPQVVINRAMSGLSFPFSRFTHCFTDLGEAGLADQVRLAGRSAVPDGAVLAELVGGVVNSNLNIHGRLTDYQLVCPAESSSFPAERQLALEDLYIAHDLATDRVLLRSHRLDREVVPVYLGYLIPTALPELARTLLLFSPAGMAMLDLWGGIPDAPATDGVTGRPRVRYRNVVLSRRNWSVGSAELPIRTPDTDESTWLLGWRAWQQAHGLPDQVFVTYPGESAAEPEATAGPAAPAAPAEDGGGWSRRSKPAYLDFTSLFCLTVFETNLKKAAGRIQFEEMLPSEDELYVRSAEGLHVCELAVELTRAPSIPVTEYQQAVEASTR